MRYNPENFNVTMQAQISRQRFSLGLKLAPALISRSANISRPTCSVTPTSICGVSVVL